MFGTRPPTSGTTTVVVPPPAPPVLKPIAPPPSPPPIQPVVRFVDPEIEAIRTGRVTAAQVPSRPVLPPAPRVNPAVVQLLPPRNVLPEQFSVRKDRMVMTENLAGDSVGLLRRLSLYPNYLLYIYQKLESKQRSTEWDLIFSRLFGFSKNRDDFLGYGTRAIPGHDQMGLFPMFTDQYGREYFNLPHTKGTQFAMRIPRQLTRSQNGRSYTSPDKELRFPTQYEEIVLTPCGVPVFPFYWDPEKNDVRSILEVSRTGAGLFQTRVDTLVNIESERQVYRRSIVVEVAEISEHRDASCLVTISYQKNEVAWNELFLPLEVLREEWNQNITDLFAGLEKMYVSVKSVSEFCAYLQANWVDAAARWVKDKADRQRVTQ